VIVGNPKGLLSPALSSRGGEGEEVDNQKQFAVEGV